MTTAPQANHAVPPSSGQSRLINLAVKTGIQLLRYWWVLGGAMMLSLVTAVCLSSVVSNTVWTAESVIVYVRLPIAEPAERLYIQPDLKTVTSLVRSPQVLQSVIEKDDLKMSPRALSSIIGVDEPRGTQKLSLTLQHPDRELGCQILESIVHSFQQQVMQIRRDQLERNLQDIEYSIKRNEARMDELRNKLRAFAGTNNLNELENELQSLATNISNWEYQFNKQKVEEQALIVQRVSVQDQLDQQKKEEQLLLESEKEAEAAEESLADNRRRQNRLNELISEERRLNEIRAKLSAKQAEFDRKLVLYEKNYLSRNDFEVIQAEVDSLKSQIMEGQKINEWKAELERIDKMVVPKAKKKRIGSPIIHQTMFKLVELDLHILAAQESQQQLSVSLADARKKHSKLKRLQGEQSGLMVEMDSISEERDDLSSQHSALMAVRDIGPYEFSIAQAPTTEMHPPNSNRKKMFAVLFIAITGTLNAPIFLLAALTGSRQTLMEYAEEQQFPFLTRKPRMTDAVLERTEDLVRLEAKDWCRSMALRIQQHLPHRGALISLIPAKRYQYGKDIRQIQEIAQILTERDEKVLIVEFPRTDSVALYLEEKHNSQPNPEYGNAWTPQPPHLLIDSRPGIFDYANDSSLELHDILQPLADNIDLISGGTSDPDRLFCQRITSLLESAQSQYSVILTYGICLHETTNVEMLSRHSHGLIVVHDRVDLMSREIRETLDSLHKLKAPFLGMAVRVGAERRPRIRFLFRHRRRSIKLAVQRASAPGERQANFNNATISTT